MKQCKMITVVIMALVFISIPGLALAKSQIDAILEDRFVIIGDKTFKVAENAVFLGQDESTKISFSSFKEGDWVEIDLTPEGEIDEMRMTSEP